MQTRCRATLSLCHSCHGRLRILTSRPRYRKRASTPALHIGYRIRQLERDREKRPRYKESNISSNETEEAAYGKVQHSPIMNRNKSLTSLFQEVTMSGECQETIYNFLPIANSTQIFTQAKDTTISEGLISFDEPLENTVVENPL
ncbi:hypothetical protein WN55_06991 [Dufourea novaeangliae]|uniref:Uncharacterized protein n=1 Tax=Dufourea novaeangliae TaxID=178035 RepID=A0A154P2Q7_DUFNO|nr:hypothetical protein WN55_06991 [Dufourea novaeangliae]